jgi:hypothetical protein
MGSSVIADIARYNNDVVDSLGLRFLELSPNFIGLSREEIMAERDARIEETNLRSAFFILVSLESDFRIDYEYRCERMIEDHLDRPFRLIYQSRRGNTTVGNRARLKEDIFKTWEVHSSEPIPQLIRDLRDAFDFRNWVAHGRYRMPKPQGKYDFDDVYSLAENVLKEFKLCRPD